MLVAVGTSNPVKVRAVERVLSRFYEVSMLMMEVASEVPPQPVGLEVTIRGAVSRAKNALRTAKEAELGVGIEAGLIPVPWTISGYMDQQFAAIADQKGRVTIGGGPSFEYPRSLVARVLGEGIEVGTAMDQLTGISELGQKQGAIGYFSKGQLNRTELTEYAVLMALLPWLNERLYFPEGTK
ncbi:MAG: inosine/xanthosine triphosphatase [Candidatus Methanomethylicaceae archaeon]|jgi:inosine/xanthosine triphosphatase